MMQKLLIIFYGIFSLLAAGVTEVDQILENITRQLDSILPRMPKLEPEQRSPETSPLYCLASQFQIFYEKYDSEEIRTTCVAEFTPRFEKVLKNTLPFHIKDSEVADILEANENRVELKKNILKLLSEAGNSVEIRGKIFHPWCIKDEFRADGNIFQGGDGKCLSFSTAAYAASLLYKLPEPFSKLYGATPEQILEDLKAGKTTQTQTMKYYEPFPGITIGSLSSLDEDFLKGLTLRLKTWESVMKSLFIQTQEPDSGSLTYVLYGWDAPKSFPEIGSEFLFEHVNSATSRNNAARASILLFRQEELFKVALHEMVHIYRKKFTTQIGIATNKKLRGNINIDETYCEVLATIANTMFSCQSKAFPECLEASLMKERHFSLWQSAKVLIVAGYTDYASYLSKRAELMGAERYSFEKLIPGMPTTAEYHLLKAALLGHLDGFLKVASSFEDDRGEAFVDFTMSIIESDSFKAVMDATMKLARELWIDPDYADLVKTGRMTITE